MDEKMKVVAITGERKAEVLECAVPSVRPGKVLVRVQGCALCTFEQRMFTGVANVPKPFVGGHELAGEIAAVGEGVDENVYKPGTKVVARLFEACGECYFCRHGEENLCTSKKGMFDPDREIAGMGGLGQYLAIDAAKIYMVPDELPTEKAVFAEPLACVLNSIERGKIEMGDDVVVVGGGIMGQLHVMAAKLSGARVIMSEPDAARREIAEKLGCDFTINPMETDPVEFVKGLTEGRGAEVVFNTTAIAACAQQAIQMVAPMGRVIMYSTVLGDKPIEVSAGWLHHTEAVLTGAVSPSVRSFRRSVSMLSKGLIDPELLLSGAFPMEECQQAFETAIRPDTFRVVIKL